MPRIDLEELMKILPHDRMMEILKAREASLENSLKELIVVRQLIEDMKNYPEFIEKCKENVEKVK